MMQFENQRLVGLIILLSVLFSFTSAQYSFTVPDTCPSIQYFSTTGYQCLGCPTNSVSFSSTTWQFNPSLSFATASVSSLSSIALLNKGRSSQDPVCVCNAGYYIDSTATTPTCSACAANSAAYSDQSSCVVCDGTTATYNSATGDCGCIVSGEVLVETTATGSYAASKSCTACPSNAIVDPTNRYTCLFCPDHRMTLTGSGSGLERCTCPAGTSNAGGQCLITSSVSNIQVTYQPSLWPVLTYRNVQTSDSASSTVVTVNSATVNGLFLNAATRCKFGADMTSCQTAANLCVLAMYETTQEMCRYFRDVVSSSSLITHGFSDWRSPLPWLYYSSAEQTLESTNIDTNVALSGGTTGGSTQSRLSYKLLTYSMNGTLISTETLTTQLQLCPSLLTLGTHFLSFGTSYDNSCSLDLGKLLLLDAAFYELFFVDSGNTWYPVPVKVLNYRSGGSLVNMNGNGESFDTDSMQLTRRFFLADSFSSRSSLTATPQVLTYAKEITLRMTMRGGSLQKIYPPLLVIRYANRFVDNINSGTLSGSVSHVSFTQQYEKTLGKVETAAIVLFFIFLVVIILAWVVKLCVWRARDGPGEISMGTVVSGFILLLGVVGELMFWIVFGVTAVLFLFFKGQDVVHVLLPSSSSVITKAFGPFLVISFVCIFLQVIVILVYQVSVDIVFIDWETPPPSLHPTMKQSGVSVWRKIFVANKWLDLQIARTHNVPLSSCILIFLLHALPLQYLATAQPDGTDLDSDAAPINALLRCFITALFFLAIAGIQRLVKYLILDCVRVKRTDEFLDLLASTNISCLLFDHNLHMFYLHGKSVHARADATSAEFNMQLLHERKNWVKARGLINEQACFSVFATPELRLAYDDQFGAARNRHLVQENEVGAGMSSKMTGNGFTPMSLLVQDEVQKAENALNSFLMDFIDKTTLKHKWELNSRSSIANWLDMPGVRPQGSEYTSLFCEDPRRHFQRLLMMGEEHILLMLYTTMLIMLEWAIDNTLAAIFIMNLLDLFIMMFRKRFGRINIAKKTLIDEKFLMQQ